MCCVLCAVCWSQTEQTAKQSSAVASGAVGRRSVGFSAGSAHLFSVHCELSWCTCSQLVVLCLVGRRQLGQVIACRSCRLSLCWRSRRACARAAGGRSSCGRRLSTSCAACPPSSRGRRSRLRSLCSCRSHRSALSALIVHRLSLCLRGVGRRSGRRCAVLGQVKRKSSSQ